MTAATAQRQVWSYRLDKYYFPAQVRWILGIPDLADIDQYYPAAENPASDQDSPAHTAFYAGFPQIRDLYRAFLAGEILPRFGADLCVQKIPTFRVARPGGGLAVARWHTDAEYAHQVQTVNFWVPLTIAHSTSAMWLESAPGRGDFAPVAMQPGQYLEFSATTLRHGNKPNQTGRSRVSFDFRVIPFADYADAGLVTVNAGTPLRLGDYYMLLRADGTVSEDGS